jgi:hypothetical protein
VTRVWTRLLAVLLFVWPPVTFATELSSSFSSLDMRGAPAIAELAAHALVGALSVAGGWGLWIGNPEGPKIATAAVGACAAVGIQSLYWTWLPRNTMPGDKLPLAALIVAVASAWLVYLRRLPR